MTSVADAAVDTPGEAIDLVVERWRAMSAADKLGVVAGLNRACDQLSESGVRRRHPGATEHEVQHRVFALRLGRDLMVDVYGWDPVVEGW